MFFFKKMGHSQSLFWFSSFPIHLTVCKVCRRLDSNRGPLVSEATTLPTEPQPLPLKVSFLLNERHFLYFTQLQLICPCIVKKNENKQKEAALRPLKNNEQNVLVIFYYKDSPKSNNDTLQ